MKKLLVVSLLFLLGSLAVGQVNLPPCDPNNPPPNCTDYFGVANWANSPLPAGAITGFTVVFAGSGYVNPVVVIMDTTGTGASAGQVTVTGGAITAIAAGVGGSGYIAPQVTVVDVGLNGTLTAPSCGGLGQTACGSGAMVTATIGGTLTGGIRKFVDTLTLPLANLPLAVPDTTTFAGADYYVIGLQEYSPKMHTDLPPTKLRGYVQLNNGTPTAGNPTGAPPAISYLGPTILATKNRPVRVLFKNLLPTGAGGNLFIPVDTTYMGAGPPYAQNRATLHLHGGATPWISDGTPHQWTTPAGEAGPVRGDSVQFVPDMWFDVNGNLIASCAGQPTCAIVGATNDPGPGNLTFFWTNQQGGRLMFYHDHAYGLTRLNVYAGEAAGYLLVDPAEETALAAATVPGTITATPDLTHLVPLVIQDKTFVPSAAQLAVEDPTWTAGGFGTTPGVANPGDLWFPHVYMPNQNPADVGGSNAFGRWDYGPWTLPGNQTVLLAATPTVGDVTIPCTSSAFPNLAVNCPITPNPSGTPEGFMDTPLVNGKAYPVLHVAPEAYRFQILSAGNDRTWNLQLYLADPLGYRNPTTGFLTEVRMVPAVEPAANATVPLCTTITPITNTSLFLGLATAVLDANGNPINGTGLPANCWPNFGAGTQAAGIPIQQTMWAADGRAGGAPDPTMAGPPFIQFGTEGGLLPAPVVIPSMPTGYEGNTRSVTITNVSVHGLWLGTAERADAVVDFSQMPALCAAKGVSPCTLILYNDAPTPAPAVDSRLDYFTGDGDQTNIGGAPNTLPGYGPNTRTIMQIIVDQPASGAAAFKLSALQAALPGIFAQTQPVPIVPEPTYPPASGGYSPLPTYSLITDAALTFFPVGSTTSVTYTDERKTIQELFTLDYGRMNATLGVELPLTNFLTQTTIPLGYIDPVTEVIRDGETQLWHITHNGVDSHFIHFHLFNVQVINRSAWDGTVRPPDQNELGWKDTVRMNPLEDILVALKPIQPAPPFPLRDSYRPMDVTMASGSNCPDPAALTPNSPTPPPCSIFTNVDPVTNNPTPTPNGVQNYGWEYVWHCHILGHEENDMMRAIAFNVPPEAPSNLVVTPAGVGQTGLNLSWTDNSASETGFTLERADDSGFTTGVIDTPVPPLSPDANGQGITWGGTQTYNDSTATAAPHYYRVQAFKPQASYWASAVVTSLWSNTATNQVGFATLSPLALFFGTVPLGTPSVLPLTLSNTSATLGLTFSTLITGPNAADFTQVNTCAGTVAATLTCPITVTFTPTVGGAEAATLTITTSDPANPTFTVLLTGTGGTLPLLTITANNTTMRYGAAVPPLTFAYSPANPLGPLTAPTCTTTATKTSAVGMYPITCSGAVDANYTITYVAGTVSITPAPLTIWASSGTMIYGGLPPAITPSYVGLVAGDTSATFSVAPNVAPTCTTTPPLTGTTPIGTYPSTCTGAVDPNYTISYAPGKVTVAKAALSITSNVTRVYGTANPSPLPLTPTGLVNGDTILSLGITVTCTTTATTASPVATYPITCTGPASTTNYNITYPAGTLTVTAAPLTITANNASKNYGQTVTFLGTEFTTTGLLGGDTVTSVTLTSAGAPAGAAVGTYTIVPSAAVGTGLTNYTITYTNGTLTVNSVALVITANNASKNYGQTATLTFTATGLLNGNTVTSVTLTSAGAPAAAAVGTYSIVPSAAVGVGLTNYTITYTNGTLTVNPVGLTITANPATRPFGTANPTFTVSYAAFVNGDSPISLGGALSCTTTATIASPPGTYPITCGGQTSTNYTITYVPAVLTVTGTVPVLSLVPTVLTFSSAINVTTPSQAVTVRNIGGAAMRINGITLGGANPGRFGLTHNCPIGGTGLAAGGSCTVNVTFTPNNNTNRSALVNVNVAAPATSGTVTLTGTTIRPAVTVSPTSLAFGNVPINTSSAPQIVTVQNTGTVPLVISSITMGGANPTRFAQTNTCPIGGTGLAAGGSCTITVRFNPNRRVARSATLTIRDNAANSPQTVGLTGTGI